jgi:hypothetical protein
MYWVRARRNEFSPNLEIRQCRVLFLGWLFNRVEKTCMFNVPDLDRLTEEFLFEVLLWVSARLRLSVLHDRFVRSPLYGNLRW